MNLYCKCKDCIKERKAAGKGVLIHARRHKNTIDLYSTQMLGDQFVLDKKDVLVLIEVLKKFVQGGK